MKPTKLISKSKIAVIALAAFGMTTLAMNNSADARRYNGKKRISQSAYSAMKTQERRKSARAFRSLDKNHDGVLTRRDFVTVTKEYKWKLVTVRSKRVSKRWQRTHRRGTVSKRWKRVLVRNVTVSPQWKRLLRTMDRNGNHVITSGEFRSRRMAQFQRKIARNYIVIKRPRPQRRYVSLAPRAKQRTNFWGFHFGFSL